MGRNRRWLAILGICAIAASACGGGSESTTQVAGADADGAATLSTVSILSPDERAAELSNILLTTMSDGTAVEALLLAVDAGYSADQIDAAIRAGVLDPDGVIASTSGDTVAPAGPAAGLIIDDRAAGSSSGLSSSELQFEPVVFKRQDVLPISELRQQAYDSGEAVGDAGAAMILQLIMSGFDQEAIVGSLVLGGSIQAEEHIHELNGERHDVLCPYIRTKEDPNPVYISRRCMYRGADGGWVYVQAADLPLHLWFGGPSSDEAADTGDTTDTVAGAEAPAPVALRTWEGRFVDTSGSVAWTTTRTTLVLVEEQPDGSLTMRRQTDSAHTADLALLASACLYVFFDTGESTSAATRPLDSLRFEGTREGVYEEGGECANSGGPAPGPGKELVTGSLDGDVLTLNSSFDGEGPSVLDPPTTK